LHYILGGGATRSECRYLHRDCKGEMHESNHHLIVKHKALLPTFEDENDEHSESKIDVGVEVEEDK
jgi:hypothetical protein